MPVAPPPRTKLHPILVDKLPKDDGEKADLLFNTKAARLAQQKIVDALDKQESAIENHFIDTVPKSKKGGVIGKQAVAEVYTKPVPIVEDWDKFYAHVARKKHWELLQKRLSEGAVKERWENHEVIPGVGVFHAVKVSITKKKK
jgi:hypothetical protein